jgi:hypothetical protein
MNETSIITYQELIAEGKISKRQEEVIWALGILKEATDTEISKYLNYEDPNYTRPRRKELLDLNVVITAGKRVCNITGRFCNVWKLNTENIKPEKKSYLDETKLKRLYELLDLCNEFQRNKIIDYLRQK